MTHKVVAWIPSGTRADPSARLRAFEIADALGSTCGVVNLFPPLKPEIPPGTVVLQKVCSKEALDFGASMQSQGSRIVYDVCDPVWMQEDVNRRRSWFPDDAIRIADMVTVPTPAMEAAVQKRYGDLNCMVIPDSVDLNSPELRFPRKHRDVSSLTVGWFGTAGNIACLRMILPALQAAHQESRLVLRIISAPIDGMIAALPGIPVDFRQWTLEDSSLLLKECDVVVMPVPLNEWTATKSSNRLQLSLALGIPPVISPLSSYMELLEGDEGSAMVARTGNDWLRHLRSLRVTTLRQTLADRGRVLVEKKCQLSTFIGRWAIALQVA